MCLPSTRRAASRVDQGAQARAHKGHTLTEWALPRLTAAGQVLCARGTAWRTPRSAHRERARSREPARDGQSPRAMQRMLGETLTSDETEATHMHSYIAAGCSCPHAPAASANSVEGLQPKTPLPTLCFGAAAQASLTSTTPQRVSMAPKCHESPTGEVKRVTRARRVTGAMRESSMGGRNTAHELARHASERARRARPQIRIRQVQHTYGNGAAERLRRHMQCGRCSHSTWTQARKPNLRLFCDALCRSLHSNDRPIYSQRAVLDKPIDEQPLRTRLSPRA